MITMIDIINRIYTQAHNNEMIDNNFTESGELLNEAALLLSTLYHDIHMIANDYVELSHDKIEWQRNDYIKRCRKLVEKFHEYDK
jgi:hypothetical protein